MFKRLFLIFSLFIFSTCTHLQHPELESIKKEFDPPGQHFDFSSSENLKNQIKALGPLNNKISQEKLVKILIAFKKLTQNLKQDELQLLPDSKTDLKFKSFCVSPRKAIPEKNEIFVWAKGDPDISFVRPLLKFYSENHNKQQTLQELFWNIGNKTYYEDYPNELKTILNKVAPSAKLILPSRLKSNILNQFLPEEIKDSIDLIKGKYYSYKEFRSALEYNRSKTKLPDNLTLLASQIPGTQVYVSSKSNNYESQVVSFYNKSTKPESLKLSDYFLRPVREDVQDIVLASVIPNFDELKKILDDAAKVALGYLASEYPTLNEFEKQLVKQKPQKALTVFIDARIARNEAASRFPTSDSNGPGDAFRHFVWSGMLIRDVGEETAREFLYVHERDPRQTLSEKRMDEFNNEQGISIAKNLLKTEQFQDEKLFDLAQEQINQKKLIIINKVPKNAPY